MRLFVYRKESSSSEKETVIDVESIDMRKQPIHETPFHSETNPPLNATNLPVVLTALS